MTTEKGGTPLTYTEALGEEICLKISTCGYGLKRLCAENTHWPTRKCIHEWRIKIKPFGDMYAKARQNQVEFLVDECLDIADDTSHDSIIKKNQDGEEYEVCNSEYVNRSRLRIDTRKWLASKLAPRVYGEKKEVKADLNLMDSTQTLLEKKNMYERDY